MQLTGSFWRTQYMCPCPHSHHPVEDAHDDQNATPRPLLKARVSPCVEKLAIKLEDSGVDSFNAVRERGNITDDSDIEDQAIFKEEEKKPTIKPGDGGDRDLASSEDQRYVSDEDEVQAEVTFTEQEEEPLDVDADFEEQFRGMVPGHVPAISATVADHDSEGQLAVNP
jgi:hypothetical protein